MKLDKGFTILNLRYLLNIIKINFILIRDKLNSDKKLNKDVDK